VKPRGELFVQSGPVRIPWTGFPTTPEAVKFALKLGGISTCQLPNAMISLFRVSGPASVQVNEADYLLAADSGSMFRNSECQYVYNLGSSSLGAGAYAVRISIGMSVIGTGASRLQ
jgi:hypothetical protein